MEAQGPSNSSLLHLEKLLRKIPFSPQATKVQDHIKKKLGLWKVLECLAGLVTAQDLNLEASLDEIYNFIINNLGLTGSKAPRWRTASALWRILSRRSRCFL